MDRREFELLRDLPDKEISADIIFTPSKDSSVALTFEQVQVYNSLGVDLVLNGSYNPNIPSIKFNFVARGVGPICRLEVNGKIHRNSGRTHKHFLSTDDCPRQNLPIADPRPDLEKKTAKEVWEILCKQANIIYKGEFVEPR